MRLNIFKPNDKVVYIKTNSNFLTIGKTYDVINSDQLFISTKNDNDEICLCKFTDFMLLRNYNMKYRPGKLKKY